MVWKKVLNTDGGDTHHFGGDDIDKISNLFSATSNVDTVDINSSWTTRDGLLKFRNPANTFSYNLRTGAITSSIDVSLPLLSSSDTFLFANTPQQLFNKTIDLSNNTIIGLNTGASPSIKKTGNIMCGPSTAVTSGNGLLHGFAHRGPSAPTYTRQDPPNGTFWRYDTGGTSGTVVGIEMDTIFARATWNYHFKAVRRPGTDATNTQHYVGMSSDTTIGATDTPIASDECGVLIGWRSTDANVQIFRNSGTSTASSTPTVTNTGLAKSTGKRIYEIQFTGGGTSCTVNIIDPTTSPFTTVYTTSFTTNLPPSTTSMGAACILANSTGSSRLLDIFSMEVESDL